jgi:hypothetical protein
MQLLGRAAVAQLSSEPLTKMSGWLPRQRSLMSEVRDRIPDSPLRTRAEASVLLLQRIATRTSQLGSAMGCPCLAQALADELGPVPCTRCGAVPNPAPGGAGGNGGATLPVPVPGLGTVGPSGSLPSLSLPALGGSGSSSSGHAAGPPASHPAGPGLPSSPPFSQPGPLPSSVPPTGPTSIGPIVVGSRTLPVPLPGGSSLAGVLPTLPGVPGPRHS